jgi:hypothetical protein
MKETLSRSKKGLVARIDRVFSYAKPYTLIVRRFIALRILPALLRQHSRGSSVTDKRNAVFLSPKTIGLLLGFAFVSVIITAGAGVYGLYVGRDVPLVYKDEGSPQSVLIDERNGERRDEYVFSLMRFSDIGKKVNGTLGYGSLVPRRASGSFARIDIGFAQYGSSIDYVSITDVYLSNRGGEKYKPLRIQYCNDTPSSRIESDILTLAPQTPCETSFLFDVTPSSGPYSLHVTYQKKKLVISGV